VAHEALHQVLDLALGEERGLDVDLGELGLAVGAQVLVAEALHDLVVAVVPGDHQELLEELGRLRQRVELAVVDARGHQELARALGRGLVQHRRLDIDETLVVQVFAHGSGRGVAHPHDALHRGPAQVEEAVLEPHLLRDLLVVHQEWRRGGRVQHLDLVREHLDLPALEVRVHRALGAAAHDPLHAKYEFMAHAVGDREGVGAIGIADHLHEALAVAQVDEDHPAMVAPAMGPAEQGDGLAEVTSVGAAAVFGAHDSGFIPAGGGSFH
jgi:hypothetical protein